MRGGGIRGRGWGKRAGAFRGGVWRRLQESRPSEQAYLVQSGHEKQDENEDVKGRDHQQEE